MKPTGNDATTWRRIASDAPLRLALMRRAETLRAIREWFWERGFIEVDAPILAPWVGMEPHLIPLRTTVHDERGRGMRLYHQTSPEYALKKLLAAGVPDCFSLAHVFRDGEVSELHNPEFTLLEWYRRDADYTAIMRDTERLVADLATRFLAKPELTRERGRIDLAPPWDRVTVAEAMKRWADLDIVSHPDDESFRTHARSRGHDWVTEESWEDLFFKLFLTCVEPKLGFPRPVILYEYPMRFAALARRHRERPHLAERFEVYIAGIELCNAFTELTDAVEQRERLEREQAERRRLGRDTLAIDEDFLDALAELPPCAGNALGVDRLVMLLTGERTIDRVTWFPHGVLAAWTERHPRRQR